MKTKLVISLLLIVLVSCNKDKSDARKMVGTWKRSLYDTMYGGIISIDTVYITKDKFTTNISTRTYYLKNNEMILLTSTSDTTIYCYSIKDKEHFTLGCWYLNDKEFRLTKIN
jgi:hypothetical protein